MLRILFILFIGLIVSLLFLQGFEMKSDTVKPSFLTIDKFANEHKTKIDVKINSKFHPTESQIETLTNDYSNIWAHLNNVYATNDVVSGKEYYTEDWFKQLCNHYEAIREPIVKRNDEQHSLQIQNWSTDGLVCTIIDSNVVFKYSYPDLSIKKTKANFAVVLLFQGDHWRIDALRFINENSLN